MSHEIDSARDDYGCNIKVKIVSVDYQPHVLPIEPFEDVFFDDSDLELTSPREEFRSIRVKVLKLEYDLHTLPSEDNR